MVTVADRVYCSGLLDLIVAGAEALYTGEDRWLEILGAAEEVQAKDQELAQALRRYVQEHREECLADGVCPYCGGEVALQSETEHHPAPFGWGTVPEVRMVYTCDNCGEV